MAVTFCDDPTVVSSKMIRRGSGGTFDVEARPRVIECADEGAAVVSKPGKPDKAKKSSAKAGVKKAGAKK